MDRRNGRRPSMFLSGMNNRELLIYTFSLHGKDVNKNELREKDGSLYNLLLQRGLNQKIKSLKRSLGFSDMSPKELLDYVYSVHGRNVTRGELHDKDGYLYCVLLKKELIQKIKTSSKRRRAGFFADRSNKELLDYVYSLHGRDVTRYELLLKDDGLYHALWRRKLLERINLKSRNKYPWSCDHGSWLIFGKQHQYNQRNPKSLEKSNDPEERAWYHRGMRGYLMINGEKKSWITQFHLQRKNIDCNEFSTFYQWRQYGIKNNYHLVNSKSVEGSNDPKERAWYDKGCRMSVVIHGEKKSWITQFHFQKMYREFNSFRKWKNWGSERCYERRNSTSFYKSKLSEERAWYSKGTRESVVVHGKKKTWLSQFRFKMNRKEGGYYQDFRNVQMELKKIIRENRGKFPFRDWFCTNGHGGLWCGFRYHGSRYGVMEKIGYNEEMRIKLAEQLEEIVGEL